jgi:[ribosomal protein S18]-alanine N-acetyltransferase
MDIKTIKSNDWPEYPGLEDEIADFLVEFLQPYGDPREDIVKCLNYAKDAARGGLILTARKDGQLIGATVTNYTGMEGYIPSNILVYIAVRKSFRGKGVGRRLIQELIPQTKGGIALHVEPDNPAARLYRSLGFTSKYLEMRHSYSGH